MSKILKALDQIQREKKTFPFTDTSSESSGKEDAKTSFVKYLVMQKQFGPNSEATQAIQEHLERKLQSLFEKLSQKLEVISQTNVEEVTLHLERNKREIEMLKEKLGGIGADFFGSFFFVIL